MAANRQQGPGRPKRQAGGFFGRRKAKPLSPRQHEIYGRLLPRLQIDAGPGDEIAPGSLFEFAPKALRMEIGFGGGEHLVRQAEAEPAIGYIGAEPFVNGMAKLLSAVDAKNLQNIRVFDSDAVILLDCLPPACLDRVDLLYPDPWPKRRHWKRRFVNEANLDRIARLLEPGGHFRFASDIADYVNWTLRLTAAQPALAWTARRAIDWREPWPGWQRTRYERKAIREGRRPAYLIFEKAA